MRIGIHFGSTVILYAVNKNIENQNINNDHEENNDNLQFSLQNRDDKGDIRENCNWNLNDYIKMNFSENFNEQYHKLENEKKETEIQCTNHFKLYFRLCQLGFKSVYIFHYSQERWEAKQLPLVGEYVQHLPIQQFQLKTN